MQGMTAAALLLATLAAPPPFGKLVTLGGHRVHLYCEGQGPATVLLLHGTPRFSFHFALVWPKVAEFARVCVYDRAGDAWSEPASGQPTAAIFVDELDRVVNHLSPRRPVVLAGHSIGGVLARAYYARHPARVSAMVLIDTLPLTATSKPPAVWPKATLDPPFDQLPARFQAAHLWATDKWYEYAAAVESAQAEQYQADLFDWAGRARRARLPVWFLSRSGSEAWVEKQRQMAAQWTRSTFVQVEHSGHDIELDQPDAVVAAIRAAVASAAAHAK